MTDNKLFDEPKQRDEFKTESPLRAFASFDMKGAYLIAKGFRPSLGHLVNYLDAMEKKEGWALLQILEANTGVPTLVFRNVGTPAQIDPDKEKMVNTILRRQGIRVDVPEGEVAGVESVQFDGHPLEAPYGDFTLTVKGLDPERVPWNRVQWRGEIEKLFQAARERPHHVKVKDFLRRESVTDMSHYYRTASVASVLRLIDMLEGWDTYALDEYISDDALFTAIGWTNPKAREACKTDPYEAVAAAIRETEVTSESPVDTLERMAEEVAEELGLEVDRESFDVAREHLAETVPAAPPAPKFDDANPNHYNGRECADIGERLSANAYQILKYCWRLGKKDDPCQELGKALWYLDSEDTLLSIRGHGTQHFPNAHGIEDKKSFLEDRLESQSDFTKSVARMLWWGYGREKLASLKAEIADHKATLDCGHGLAL